jgi:electron transfer flavoprotein alpha subunit
MVESGAPVFVIAEQEDGGIDPVTLQLLGKARQLADDLGVQVGAVVLGQDLANATRAIVEAGADIVFQGDSDLLVPYQAELHTEIIAHCIDLVINREGILEQRIPAYGGMMTIVCPEKRPQMATVANGVFPKPVLDPTRSGRIVPIEVPEAFPLRAQTLEIVAGRPEGVSLESASVIVAGGAGAGDHDGWRQIAELADALNAGLGSTRPAVDSGWAELETMIGQSGKMVHPELYIGIGLSGELQHMVGIVGARIMIAINSDPKAPVFEQVDYGVVEDCRDFVPALIGALKNSEAYTKSGTHAV